MDYVIHCRGLPFTGDTLRTRSIGGSESAAFYIGRELARRGHRVTVFTSAEDGQGVYEGVNYVWHGPVTQQAPMGERFDFYALNTPMDVLIMQRYPECFAKRYASKINVWQLHDLALYRSSGAVNPSLRNIDIVTTVSAWQGKQVADVYGINPAVLRVVENGVDPTLYERAAHIDTDAACDASKRVLKANSPLRLLYQSRPERGLEHLVRPGGVMSRLPAAHLFYCAYDFTHDGTRAYYAQLDEWAAQLPNVTNLGALTKQDLAEVQCECDALFYVTEFEEVSCITAMEAMHAHLPFISSQVGALPETCEGSGSILLPLKDGFADEDEFVRQIERLLADLLDNTREGPTMLAKLSEQQRDAKSRKTWKHAVDQLESHISDVLIQRSNSALARHCIEHSDITMLRYLRDDMDMSNPIVAETYAEHDKFFEFTKSEDSVREYYRVEQERWVNEVETFITENDNTVATPRYRGVLSALHAHLDKMPAGRRPQVLDFGAAYGHYIVNLAKEFPGVDFVGLETSPDVVRMGRAWCNQEKLKNCEIHIGDQSSLVKRFATGQFDVVIAAEILEHVVNWSGVLAQLKNQLRSDGILIATTPFGRHEWNGSDFNRARQHLHHFERQDIIEICGKCGHDIMCAPSAFDVAGEALGSWIWVVRAHEADFPNAIDMERKRHQLKPRQTVSACLIVKDGATTIEKCLLSFIKYVDEIIIGIDPNTVDHTREVIRQVQARHLFKPFNVFTLRAPALNSGFADARNQTIDRASGDWIFWLDADEEVHNPHHIHNYLRPSSWDGLAMPQMHYAVDPPQVLTTDYPTRLFRQSRGVRFHGLVHEHPEVEQGKAIPYTTVIHDVQLVHSGYVNETTRRKRFQRNYPLLVKDCEINPNRVLNRFLMLRDIAQSIHFEREVGVAHPEQLQRANHGKELFNKMLANGSPTRMILDALPFYSMCVDVTGGGFNAEVTLHSEHAYFKELQSTANVKGRFADRQTYLTLLNRISQEMTQHYESRYA